MLDHLSYGRLDVGVGRGVSPYELRYHKVEHDDSRDIFFDAFDCLSAGLTTDSLTYKGPHYTYENVPIATLNYYGISDFENDQIQGQGMTMAIIASRSVNPACCLLRRELCVMAILLIPATPCRHSDTAARGRWPPES